MSNVNSLPSERAALVGIIAPVSLSVANHDTGWIPVKNFRRFMAVLQAGVLGTSATASIQLLTSTDLVGGGTVVVSGAVTPNLVKATDDGKSTILNVNTDSLLSNVQSVAFRVAVGANASLGALAVYGFDAYAEPASTYESSTVAAITSY